MALEFSGPATRFTDDAIEQAAKEIGCPVAAIRAVIDVESRALAPTLWGRAVSRFSRALARRGNKRGHGLPIGREIAG